MRILVMGGTRFIGVFLTRLLVDRGHEVVLLNRGNRPAPVAGVEQIHCDRNDSDALKGALANTHFDAIFDNTGRELSDTQPLIEIFRGRLQHFIYVSSAGVYQKSDQMPHLEGDAIDPKSRHRGKFDTEVYLAEQEVPFTAVRPVYIYGPQNYNDLEAWFFDRIARNRPIPIPGHGMALTQLGHVQDLARALVAILGNTNAVGQIYNISGEKAVSFDGLARACAQAMDRDPEQLPLVHYDPSRFDFGKRKAFPLRLQHFFTSIAKALSDLDWEPEFDLISGLKDSYQRDYLASGRQHQDIDFSLDEAILSTVAVQ